MPRPACDAEPCATQIHSFLSVRDFPGFLFAQVGGLFCLLVFMVFPRFGTACQQSGRNTHPRLISQKKTQPLCHIRAARCPAKFDPRQHHGTRAQSGWANVIVVLLFELAHFRDTSSQYFGLPHCCTATVSPCAVSNAAARIRLHGLESLYRLCGNSSSIHSRVLRASPAPACPQRKCGRLTETILCS